MFWIVVVLAFAMFVSLFRATGCDPSAEVTGYFCSFRVLGLVLMLIDSALLWTLLWCAAHYDPERPAGETPTLLAWPHRRLAEAARASRDPKTPHRWKHRIGFWAFIAMTVLFVWLVYFGHVAVY
jgi:hypothetical protein